MECEYHQLKGSPARAAVIERLANCAPRVVFLSSPHQAPHPFFRQPNPMAALHASIERLLAAAGLETTFLRPGMFASNAVSWWAPAIRAGGVVRWPYGAAETAPVDERDVAAVAARTVAPHAPCASPAATSVTSASSPGSGRGDGR